MPTTSDRIVPRHRSLLAVLVALSVGALALVAPSARAASEAQQGAQLLQNLQAGKTSCASLSTSDFDHIGEYVMERMLGSATAHEAMNRQMSAMMGSSGETQAHVYMGQRFSGCATGRPPAAFGAMMGMMGGAGMMGSGYNGAGTGMMGLGASSSANGSGWSSGDTVMVVLMGVLLALVAGVIVAWHPWRTRDGSPLDTLRARYARGEIDQQEFDRLRQALGGTT